MEEIRKEEIGKEGMIVALKCPECGIEIRIAIRQGDPCSRSYSNC